MMGLCFVLFGTISMLKNTTLYITLAFLIRIIQGLSSSAIQTTCYSTVANFYPERREELIGKLEACCGFGFVVGPVLGSVLHSLGGFTFMAVSFGTTFIGFSFFIRAVYPK